MVGIMAGFCYKRWRFGLSWVLVGLAYSLLALLVVIPAFRGEPSDSLARYYWLGESPSKMLWTMMSQPIFVLRRVFAVEHIITLLQLLAPVAFLPLLGLPQLLLAVPTLIYNFLAEWPSQTTIYTHYMALVIPFIHISTVFGLERLQRFVKNPRLEAAKKIMRRYGIRSGAATGFCASVILIATLMSWIYENPIMGNAALEWRSGTIPKRVPGAIKSAVPMILPNEAVIREGLSHVPYAASVLTTEHYAPHLSHRPWIQIIPRPPASTLRPEVEAIFLNLRDARFFQFRSCEDDFETLKAAARANFGIVFYRDGVVLVQKEMGDKSKLESLLDHWPSCQ
jgi:uncharacterized membrane protein